MFSKKLMLEIIRLTLDIQRNINKMQYLTLKNVKKFASLANMTGL